MDRLFCGSDTRQVASDNTLRFAGQRLQLLPGPEPSVTPAWSSRSKVHQHLAGGLAVVHRGGVAPRPAALAHSARVPRPFRQVDVFTTTPYAGNPVAVVLDSEGLSTAQMQRFANWTNLSETTFVLPPSAPGADYQVRIFTPQAELPFAGHPTLGTCYAWLSDGGRPTPADVVVQQCSAGLIPVRRTADGLAFAAPPLVRSGPVDESLVVRIASVLGIDRADIVDAEWADNGPGWVAVLLHDADAVLALRPGLVDQAIGVAGPYPEGSAQAFEVRAFFPKQGSTAEDPVTGSLNASLAEWLLRTGRARAPYVASQGTALGRSGRVHVTRDPDGTIWVGGGTVTCVTGQVDL
jgi:PhzF family phenazine biosynthesis protein